MTLNNMGIWASILVMAVGGGVAWGTNQGQTSQNARDIEKLQEEREEADEQRVRMEERQIRIQRDVEQVLDAIQRLNE